MAITTYDVTESLSGGEKPLRQPSRPTPPPGLEEDQLIALHALANNREQLDPEKRALVESLAQKYGIPLSPKTGFVAQPSKTKETVGEIGQTLKVAALPMAGQLAGSIGGAASPVLGGTVLGGVAGALLGVKANELLGISKPDDIDYLLSAGAPLLGGGLGRVGRRLIPGSAAAEQQMGAEAIRQVPSAVEASRAAVNEAYQKITTTPLPVSNFSNTVKNLLSTEETMKQYGVSNAAVRRAMTTTTETLAKNPQGLPLTEVNGLLKRYREKVAGLETKGGEQYGAYKALRKALFEDMDAAVATASKAKQDTTLLRQAMGESKRLVAREELEELIQRYGVKLETIGGETFETINPTKVLNKLREIDFAGSVGKQQFARIEQTLKELARLPHPSMELRTGLGTGGRMAAAVGIGTAGAVVGTPLTGAGAAVAAYAGLQTHSAVARLFMTDPGRKFLVKLFKHNQGRMGERTGQVLQFAATQLEEE